MSKVINNAWLCLLLFLIYCTAWQMQSHLLVKGDQVWQMHLARLFWQGGQYVRDFFEINPPLSIILYLPTLFIGKLCSVSPAISLRIYLFLLATVSLGFIYFLLTKIFLKKINVSFLMGVIAFLYLILPVTEFGQRENLLIIFTTPYFLLQVARLQQHSVHWVLALFIGIVAALGFLLKPFFLVTLLLTESYVFWCFFKKNRASWVALFFERIEIYPIIFLGIIYFFAIFFCFHAYLHQIVPIASLFYYRVFSCSVTYLIFNVSVFYCLMIYGLCFLNRRQGSQFLCNIIVLAMIGSMAAYFLQRIPWYYHQLPMLAMAVLLNGLCLLSCVQKDDGSFYKKIGSLISVLFVTFYFSLFFVNFYFHGIKQKDTVKPLISFLYQHAYHQPVYFFSAYSAYMESVLYHGDTYHASRLQFLFWMRDYYKKNTRQDFSVTDKRVSAYFVNMLSEDLNKNKPRFVLVDKGCVIVESGRCVKTDYLKFLNDDKSFKSAWQPYHFVKSFQDGPLYHYDVYQREK